MAGSVMKKHSGVVKMICYFSTYEKWEHTLKNYCRLFKKNYAVYPNIMLACGQTYWSIDSARNGQTDLMDDIFGSECFELYDDEEDSLEEEILEQGDAASLRGYETKNYSITFCLDESISPKSFLLVYDESPTFDSDASGGKAVSGEGSAGIGRGYIRVR